jgi:hypothetical protein
MIHDQNIPMILWEEESMKIMYVQNKSPHHILKNMTPEESFTEVNPEVGHFRIFGFLVYVGHYNCLINFKQPSET